MMKEVAAVSGAKGGQSSGQGLLEFVEGAGGGLAQVGLEFGEGLFDVVEVGTVRRQVTDAGSPGRDELFNILDFVGGEVYLQHVLCPELREGDIVILDFKLNRRATTALLWPFSFASPQPDRMSQSE